MTQDDLPRLLHRVEVERRAREQAEHISEQATRDLYERQQELELLFSVARAANESTDVRGALSVAVNRICEHTGWPIGHVFLTDPAVGLRPAAIWHLDDPQRFAAFRAVTETTVLASGQSLGGRVLATGEPQWLPDIAADPDFAQARVSSELRVRAGFGFPLLVGAEVVGVMEFFNGEVEAPDVRLLELTAQIGTTLGRAIERDRAQTAQRRLNDELAARAAELQRSNDELAQFASIASHDLQEPLRKVRTFTQRVIEVDSPQLSERGSDYLQRASNAAARMQTLVQDLLAFSRVTTQGRGFEPVDLAQVTAEVLEDLELAVQRTGAEVRLGALPTIDADALQMRQLMQNLLGNALKFVRDGVPAQVSVDAAPSGEIVRITVRDNGIGFDPQYQERIFRVFERLHGRGEYDGTGIGLAPCRKIVERHGGTVSADGEPGVGATFTVTVPVRQPALEPTAAAV